MLAIIANASQVIQFYINLISYFIKFQKQRILLWIEFQEKLIGYEFWQIFVKDPGVGFDEKKLDRIFRPFERLHRINQYEGTRMGLSICKNIVESQETLTTEINAVTEKVSYLPCKQKPLFKP